MKNNERLQAVLILTRLLKDKTSLAIQIHGTTGVPPMTKELCFGFCRHYYRLAAIANSLLDKKPKAQEVWVAILLGIYQLHYMNQPDYVVVKETVAVLEYIKMSWAKALVNAVLRNFCRQQQSIINQLAKNAEFNHGQPAWLLKRIQRDWPNDWQDIAAANDVHPPMTLRVNQLKGSVDNYLSRLQQVGIAASLHEVAPLGITLALACDVRILPGFTAGMASVQDGAAQLAVELLDLEPGQRVLDACCAPGGKTSHILETEPNIAECVAVDVDARRLKRVEENFTRLGLSATVLQGDAQFPETWWDGKPFDRILLDAPCSASGVIRRHSDIKLIRTDAEISAVCILQKAILNALWPLLAPGGKMVYATCSVNKEENQDQIAEFLKTHSDCTLLQTERSWGRATGYGYQILPGEHGMDGFFYSILCKL